MRARAIGACRGDGSCFIKLGLIDVDASLPLGVLVASGEGAIIPSAVRGAEDIPGYSRSIVVITPNVPSGALSIFITSKHQADYLDHPITISADRLVWESRFLYRFKKDLAQSIRTDARQCDRLKDIDLYVDRIIPDNEHYVLWGRCEMPCFDDVEIRINCFDFTGRTIQIEPILLDSRTMHRESIPRLRRKTIGFSVKLPNTISEFTLFACDMLHPSCTGYFALHEPDVRSLFEDGKRYWRNAALDSNYDMWFRRKQTDSLTIELQRGFAFRSAPMFSIVTVWSVASRKTLERTIGSIVRQSYSNWELVIVDASCGKEELIQIVSIVAGCDARIRFTSLKEDPGPTECFNYGIAACSGDYVCLLEEGGFLEADALFEFAREVDDNPDADFIYCDEDRADDYEDRFFEPCFKPAFDIDLLRCWNYIGHFPCIRRVLFDRFPPPCADADGAHLYNITLNAVEHANSVRHISLVLYHSSLGGGALSELAASNGTTGDEVLIKHLKRLGLSAVIERSGDHPVRHMKYLINESPLVTIIIPNKDCSALLLRCVKSILEKTTYCNYEIVIIENNSVESETFGCYEELLSFDERVRVVTWGNEFNYSKIINYGASHARGDYLLFLNNDIEVIAPNWLENMMGIAQRDDVGAVGAKLLYSNNTIQHAGIVMTSDFSAPRHVFRFLPDSNSGYFHNLQTTRECTVITAACMLTKRSAFNQVEGFTEALAVDCNDVDFCLKLRKAGYVIVWEPSAVLYHYESVSRGLNDTPEKLIRSVSEFGYLWRQWANACINTDYYSNSNCDPVYFTLIWGL